MNRLSKASENTGWSENFGFDQYGNTWLSSASGLFAQPFMPTTQSAFDATANKLVGVTYDGAGNQKALGGAATFTYDAESRQVSATNSWLERVGVEYHRPGGLRPISLGFLRRARW